MKKVLIILGGLILVVLASAFVLPIVFKDDIKTAIDRQLAESINAEVVFDIDNFSLSFFRNFPNLTATMKDFGIVNREPFSGEVLFAADELSVEVNLKDILFGDQLSIKGISVDNPIINILVLEDGRANYDIAIASSDSVAESTESSDFSFRIDHWEIKNADLIYDDRSIPYRLELRHMDHSGSGDFTQDVFDLTTKTRADSVSTSFDGVEYLSNKRVQLDAVIAISEEYSRYEFRDNSAFVNDFNLKFDGWFKMNDDSYDMDIRFDTPGNSFKSLLSLVPGMYTESFNDVKTDGTLAFNGFVKGTYSETSMPAYNLTLKVDDAMFHYPELPTAVNNINIDLTIDNQDGKTENTSVALNKLHMDFGSNPFDATATISRLYPTDLKATVDGKLNLQELSTMFPIEGLSMSGNFALKASAEGIYDSLKSLIPTINANMSLANGYFKSNEFPVPLEDVKFSAAINSPSGKMEETTITIEGFSLLMNNEKLSADLVLKNLQDYNWDVNLAGALDLGSLMNVFPVEGMTMAGKVVADLHSRGKMSDLEANRFDRLPTSGTASVDGFTYSANDLPYTIGISSAAMSFDPQKIELKTLSGTIGKSDFAVNGSITNYLAYVMKENESLRGSVNFTSGLLDLNEFMSDEEEVVTPEDTTSYSVIQIPSNLDFVLTTKITTAKMMDYTLTDVNGQIVIRDGVANLEGLHFGMLGGKFTVTGTYDPRDIAHPVYDFGLSIDNMSIRQAASSFTIVNKFAPIAGLVNGNFSTDFKISGELSENLLPKLGTVNGAGLVKVAQASLTGSKLVSAVTSVTSLENTNSVSLKDVLMNASIKDGRLNVQPFNVSFGDYMTSVTGSTGIDGSIDYNLKMDVPAGQLGNQLNAFVSRYSGGQPDPNDKIPVTIKLGGSVLDPSPQLVMSEQKEQLKEAATTAAKEQLQDKAQELVKGTEAEKLLNKVLPSDNDSAGQDSTATPAKPAEEIKERIQEEAVDKIQNLLKRRK